MVARSAARGFTPEAPARVVVAADGAYAAIVESARVVVVDVPGLAVATEVGLDGEAASDVAWLGGRLLVLARHAAHSTAHLVDVAAGASVAEIRLESPMRLVAAVGLHALVVGSAGAAVLTAIDTHLMPYQFMSRSIPGAAGAAGGQFVVALGGVIEEWDPTSRTPRRRMRLPRPAAITAVGGSDRVVWMTTQHEPARIEVLPLVNRGQPKAHELPEPIAHVHAHPRTDVLACVGAESGRLYIVDLDGKTRLRTVAADGIDRVEAAGLVAGRMLGVVAAQAHRALALITLDGRDRTIAMPVDEPAPAVDEPEREPIESTLTDEPVRRPHGFGPSRKLGAPTEHAAEHVGTAAAYAEDRRESADPSPRRDDDDHDRPDPDDVFVRVPAPRAAWSTGVQNLGERFSALRGPKQGAAPATRAGWRDDLAHWARAVVAGTFDKAAPTVPVIDVIARRFGLPASLGPALALLYGVHLAGHHGAAPVDVARVLGRTWDEALGKGQLAAQGLAIYERSRVILADPILRALDELPPATGTLVGTPAHSELLGPCAVVSTDHPIDIAERLQARIGAILVAHDDAAHDAVLLEARARGAVALLRASPALAVLATPMILVGPDADTLGIPVL